MTVLTRRSLLLACASIGVTRNLAAAARETFGAASTAEEVTEELDLRGKTFVVTGCTSGLGFESMRVLALRGAHVIGTGRTLEQARLATAKVKGRTTPLALELSEFDSVVECAKRVQEATRHVDALMLNAGIALDRPEQVRGLELQFVVNHLGHFLLANRLLDRVQAAPQGRVVTVGSGSHFEAPRGGIQFGDLSGKGWEGKAYAHSKLANGLFSLELSRRLRGTRATSNCLTPGPVYTDIFKDWATAVNREAKTPGQGAATQCYVATNPALAMVNGEYFKDCRPSPQSDLQRDQAMASRLWDVSTRLTREFLV